MAPKTHQRAGLTERGVYARRLAVAAILSGLVHLVLWNGLTTTRLSLLGGKPQDATARKPALKPKLAADFPLRVPQSPNAAEPTHERPLDMEVAPRQPQDVSRTTTDREKPPQPEQSEPELPLAAMPPALDRPTTPRAATPEKLAVDEALAPDRKQLAPSTAPAPTTADRVAVAPGIDAASQTPRPAAAAARPAAEDAAGVARRRPREVAMAPAAAAASPPALPFARIESGEPAPQPRPVAAADRRAVAVATPDRAGVSPESPAPISPTVGTSNPAAAAPPRPRASTSNLTDVRARGDRGSSPAVRGPTTADADASATDEAGSAAAAPGADVGTAVGSAATGLAVGRPASARPSVGSGFGEAASSAPLARSSPAGVGATAATATDTTAATITLPAAGPGVGTLSSQGVGSGGPAPAAMTRLGSRPSAATRSLAGSTTAPAGPGLESDGEELSSVAETMPLSTAGTAAAAGVSAGELAGRDRGDDTAAAPAPRPLDRVAAVTLPVEGRVREIAVPFARRSRANRDAGGRERPEGDLLVREKTRAAADAMVDRGLDFLARAQQPDGRWRLGAFPGATAADTPKLSCDTAATGLAILSFLGAGHDHFGGRHRDTVRRGLEFLLSVQKPDGDLYLPADRLSDSCAWLYSHGIATMALCDAVGMTGDPLIKPAATKACGFIAASQHPTRGGWRYTPRSDADLSVSGW
ncbi:MAG: hypothetical protein ACKOWG_01885, partial [Planctomycetia bacterium]